MFYFFQKNNLNEFIFQQVFLVPRNMTKASIWMQFVSILEGVEVQILPKMVSLKT